MTIAAATALNHSCFCVPVDARDVYSGIGARGPAGFADGLAATHPGLFSSQAVFVAHEDARAMAALVAAVEHVVALPAWQAVALQDAPPLATRLPPRRAVLHGFDFHLTRDGPRLIEINTNAGGITLAAAAARALHASCPPSETARRAPGGALDDVLWDMFLDVWRQARGERPLRRVVIVDEAPERQYLYPEFVLFQTLFAQRGVTAAIADPEELIFDGSALRHGGESVDMVYNRLTDFYLQAPGCEGLRAAALADAVVLTPDPRAHALYANKRNLARLTQADDLSAWGVPGRVIDTLMRHIPPTEVVRPEAAERLWANRKRLFFKPASGYGSRGSYRGDKITRGRFAQLVASDYVAQALTPAAVRLGGPGDVRGLRFDVRSYVYQGRSLLLTARVYQGQTTNFRTPGGGFAPIVHPPVSAGAGDVVCCD